MNKFVKGFFVILLGFFIAGCGSGGTNGQGNTVYISAYTKNGASGVAFAHYSSTGAFVGNTLSYTIKSTAYSIATAITNSDVTINKFTFSYTPVSGAPAFTPAVPSVTRSYNVSPGGTTDIDNIAVMASDDLTRIISAGGAANTLYYYTLNLTFSGIENNTGATVSTTVTPTVIACLGTIHTCQ